jgi:1-pyrroline-5-carboxylate dehydrogenase
MNNFLLAAQPRMTLFTGSGRVAEKLSKELNGRIKIEDAGFDWKILGADVPTAAEMREYVAYMSDQDAYACSGQKCSAQSIVFAHNKWVRMGFFDQIERLAARRQLSDLTIGPVLTWTTEAMLAHTKKLAAIPGAKVLFGGKELNGGKHTIPKRYGAIEPTAVFVPLTELVKEQNFALCTTEVFGPFQVVTEWSDDQLPTVLNALERMSHHLTAGVVSNDPIFL